jgi:hypothetical protein
VTGNAKVWPFVSLTEILSELWQTGETRTEREAAEQCSALDKRGYRRGTDQSACLCERPTLDAALTKAQYFQKVLHYVGRWGASTRNRNVCLGGPQVSLSMVKYDRTFRNRRRADSSSPMSKHFPANPTIRIRSLPPSPTSNARPAERSGDLSLPSATAVITHHRITSSGFTSPDKPVIGRLKDDQRMGRNYFAGGTGDATNAILAAVGSSFRRLLAWLKLFSLALLVAIEPEKAMYQSEAFAWSAFFTWRNRGRLLPLEARGPI